MRLVQKTVLIIPLIIWGLFSACKKNGTEDSPAEKEVNFREMEIPDDFNYATTEVEPINVEVLLMGGNPYAGAKFDIYLDDPAAAIDNPSLLDQFKKVSSFKLDKNGKYTSEIKIPAYLQKIYLVSQSIGIPAYFEVSKSSAGFVLKYDAGAGLAKTQTASLKTGNRLMSTRGFTTLDTRSWNNVGFPDYLTDPVFVSASFLNKLQTALPRGVQVNPTFVDTNLPRSIALDLEPGQTADVSITFIFANSRNLNTLGYYWYNTDNPPTKASAITNKSYIFPSTSRSGIENYSGLQAGHTVKLIGPNSDGSFPANTTIGFFLISNGFTPSTTAGVPGTINTGRTTYYSDSTLNSVGTGNMAGIKQRMVALYDPATNKIVWSVEDGVDADYSDIAFFASWNPNEAIDVSDFPQLPESEGSDDTGFLYYPAENTNGTLLFEDSWPRLADFDMNDMVLNYRYSAVIDAYGQYISEINFKYELVSVAAQQNNSFAVMIPDVAPGNVQEITNLNLDGVNVNSSSTRTYELENGHTNDVVVKVVNDASTVLGGNCVNNEGTGAISRPPEVFSFTIKFKNLITVSDFNKISPFIIPRGERTVETHLANQRPSSKADTKYFGSYDDNSSVSAGIYYLSNTKNSAGNINWAVDVPEQIPYPKSGQSMTGAYPNFVDWAHSRGELHIDWYTSGSGNRVVEKLVNPPGAY